MLKRAAPSVAAAFHLANAAMRTTLRTTRSFNVPSWGRGGAVMKETGNKTWRSFQHNNSSGSSEGAADGFVLWGGRVAGLLIASGGALSFRGLVQQSKLGNLDLSKLEDVFLSARGLQKGEAKTEHVTLNLDDFSKVMLALGISDATVVATLFEVFDTDKNKRIDWEEWSIGMTALTQREAGAKLQTIFDFCDLNRDGKVSKTEIAHSLASLLNVASHLTKGKFLKKEVLEDLEVSEEDVKLAVTDHALQDIFQRTNSSLIKDDDTVSFAEFERWATSGTASSKILLQLFDLLGGVVAEGHHGHVSHPFHPDRYGGYAFILGRLAKLVNALSAKARYLAYSSDVGEAVRPVVPPMVVNATYAIAIGYCCFDVAQHASAEQKKPDGEVARAIVHQSTFHALASIGLPFLIIHSAVHAAHTATKKSPPAVARWGPTAVGLLLIPVLPFVCDEPVEHALDYAFEKGWPPKNGGGGGAKPH